MFEVTVNYLSLQDFFFYPITAICLPEYPGRLGIIVKESSLKAGIFKNLFC